MLKKKELDKSCKNILSHVSPGSTALQLRLQPALVPLQSVLNRRLTVLLLLVNVFGRFEPQRDPIKVVPSPSVIVRWS